MSESLKLTSQAKTSRPNRYHVLYDDAAKKYAEVCKNQNRRDIHGWKTRLEWLDRKLAEVSE